MKIYYAHCLALYDTPQEDRDVVLLESFGDVINPNTPEVRAAVEVARSAAASYLHPDEVSGAVMERVFKPMVLAAGVLAFRALPDMSIPAGVAKEIRWALEAGSAVIELPSSIRRRTLSVELTREYLREAGQR